MKVHEFNRLENKLQLKTRNSGDRLAWFEYDGKVITRTKRSHGNKDLPVDLIRQQLKVNNEQFAGLISCAVSLEDYVKILRDKRFDLSVGNHLIPARKINRLSNYSAISIGNLPHFV